MVIGRLATFESSSVTWPSQPGIDEACGGVDEEAEAAQARLALQAGDQVVGKHDPLQGRSEHELARVQDERSLIVDLDELRQVFLRLPDVDVGYRAL
jgi:hypothetical protein